MVKEVPGELHDARIASLRYLTDRREMGGEAGARLRGIACDRAILRRLLQCGRRTRGGNQ
jgi:hypothetical protein